MCEFRYNWEIIEGYGVFIKDQLQKDRVKPKEVHT